MTTSYSVGDAVRVSESNAIGVVIGFQGSDELEVQLLERGADRIYRIGSDYYIVNKTDIAEHHVIGDDGDLAPRAYDALGFRMLDGGSFVKHTDEEDGQHMFPVGEAAFDLRSDDDDDDAAADETLGGFIVADHECEPFTHAPEDSQFVRDTHDAVRAFNAWIPKNEQEAQARSFMIRQESRASHIDDEARFARNMPATNYSNPGTHAK